MHLHNRCVDLQPQPDRYQRPSIIGQARPETHVPLTTINDAHTDAHGHQSFRHRGHDVLS
jgi:hypothetical protein